MAYQDFTTYTEVDTGGNLSQTSARSTFADVDNAEACYLYKDFTADYFSGDLLCDVDINISAGLDQYPALLGFANSLGTQAALVAGSGKEIYFILGNLSAGTYTLYAREINAGGDYYSSATGTIDDDTTYYCRFKRDTAVGTYGTIYLYVYPTAADRTAGTDLTTSTSLALHEDVDFRYCYGLQNQYTTGGGNKASGYCENLDLAVVTTVAYTLTTSAIAITITPVNATIISARTMITSAASIIITPVSAILSRGYTLLCSAASIIITPVSATINSARSLITSTTSIVITGANIILTAERFLERLAEGGLIRGKEILQKMGKVLKYPKGKETQFPSGKSKY